MLASLLIIEARHSSQFFSINMTSFLFKSTRIRNIQFLENMIMMVTKSLRARFMITAVVVAAIMLGIYCYAYDLVSTNSSKSNQQIRVYYNSHQVIRDAKEKLQSLETIFRHNLVAHQDSNNSSDLEESFSNYEYVVTLIVNDQAISNNNIFAGLPSALEDMTDQLGEGITTWTEGQKAPSVELIDGLRKLLHLIERRFYDGIVDQAYNALDASGVLEKIILYLAFGTFGILMVAYSLFELSIRRPVLLVAKALRAEGRGDTSISSPPIPKAIEISLLVDAFNSMRQQVRARQLRLHSVLESASDGIITFDWTGKIESINGAGEKLFDMRRGDVIGLSIADMVPLDKFKLQASGEKSSLISAFVQKKGEEFEVPIERRDGTIFHISLKLSEFSIADNHYYNAMVSDISERKKLIDKLTFLAQRDSLTGLLNRFRFIEELQWAVDESVRETSTITALISIDLDRFKHVNDSLGHHAGDELLQTIAKLLTSRCRKADILARLGGDEFMILLDNTSESQALKVAEDYRLSLADFPFNYNGKVVDVGCSIGVAMLGSELRDPEQLMIRADLAMRVAKQSGRNRVQLFEAIDEETRKQMSESANYSSIIEKALREDLFYPVFQPIVKVDTGEVVGFETLARIKDGANELMLPIGLLIANAERFGLALDIDRRIISKVYEMITKDHSWLKDKWISFNLSAQSLGDDELFKIIKSMSSLPMLPTGSLVFEITETAAVTSLPETKKFLKKLKKLGCLSALDDFGSGYSSFAYLRELHVDFIKLDREYVRGIHRDPVEVVMIQAVQDVAFAMGARTIAEGVEEKEDQVALQKIGVQFAQGFLFGHPGEITTNKDKKNIPSKQYKELERAAPAIELKLAGGSVF